MTTRDVAPRRTGEDAKITARRGRSERPTTPRPLVRLTPSVGDRVPDLDDGRVVRPSGNALVEPVAESRIQPVFVAAERDENTIERSGRVVVIEDHFDVVRLVRGLLRIRDHRPDFVFRGRLQLRRRELEQEDHERAYRVYGTGRRA